VQLRFRLVGRSPGLVTLRGRAATTGGGVVEAGLDDAPLVVDDYSIGERFITVRSAGRELRLLYEMAGGHIHVAWRGETYEFAPAELDDDEAQGATGGFTPEIISPMPGKVLDVLVVAGDSVEAEQPLLLLEAMKMEQTVRAPTAARVVEVRVDTGAMVGPGEVLVVIEEP